MWRQAGPIRWRWFARGFWVNVNQVATAVVGRQRSVDRGPRDQRRYRCGLLLHQQVITVLQNQPQILASVALPGISHMKTSESRERIQQATTSLTQAMLLLAGGIVCVILAVNQQFVTWWLGAQFFGGMQLTVILLLTFLLRQADYTLAVTLFAFGHEKLLSIRALVDGAISVAHRDSSCAPLGNAWCGIRVPVRSGLGLPPR